MSVVFTATSVLLMLAAIAVGAAAFRVRAYSIASLLLSLVFGGATGFYGPRIPEGLPTPWVGVLERVSIAAFMLWLAVLAIRLIRIALYPVCR